MNAVLGAPLRKNTALFLCAGGRSFYLFDIAYAECVQLHGRFSGCIMVWRTTPGELGGSRSELHGEDQHSRGDPLVHEIGRLQNTRTDSVIRDCNDVDMLLRILRDECPARASKRRVPQRGNGSNQNRKREDA